jgi:hypothetical protein
MLFSLNLVNSREPPTNSHITDRIRIPSKKIRFLSNLGKKKLLLWEYCNLTLIDTNQYSEKH